MRNAMRITGWALTGLVALAAVFVAFRWVAIFLLAICLVAMVLRQGLRNQRFSAFMLIGFIVSSVQPFDISFEARHGPPRILPVIYGYPTRETMEEARRGEVLLGGCVVNGFEPTWVLVW